MYSLLKATMTLKTHELFFFSLHYLATGYSENLVSTLKCCSQELLFTVSVHDLAHPSGNGDFP